jgi:hypothetical protein
MSLTLDTDDTPGRPTHWWCRLRRHRTLSWSEDTDDPNALTAPDADIVWLPAAYCGVCDRPQPVVRLTVNLTLIRARLTRT